MAKYISKLYDSDELYYLKDSEARANLIDKSEKGAASGVATLDTTGRVPMSQLPSEVGVQSDWNATSGKAVILNKPTNVSAFTNDTGYLTEHQSLANYYTKTEVNGLVDTPHQEYVTVDAYAELPATGSKDTIYRVSNYNGSTEQVNTSVYSEYAWNGSLYIFLCVKSQIGEIFDISVYNNNAKYADLAAALNGGANIPQSLQKGGMSVKFVQSSDNNYVQYRLMAQSFTTDTTQWAICDDGVYVDNLDFMEVELDSNNKLLESRKKDGTKVIHTDLEVKGKIINENTNIDFDVSANNDGAVFESLSALLSSSNLNTLIPIAVRKGGMSIKFIQGSVPNSDNNYVQYRLMAQSFTTDTTQWAICDDGVYVDNLDFMEVELDSNNKLLESRKKDGTKVIHTDLEVKGKIINENTNIDFADIIKTIESLYEGSHKMNIVTVKKDGSGDFTTIQEAINSITDASVINQYEVQVFDDYYVNDLSQLYAISSPTVHTSSDVPLMAAYIITKDYVHLRGMGGMREVYVENPNQSFPANRFQNVHNIFVIGNCRIENFVFKIKGGRYAMHQDSSGDLFGLDSFKTTVYKNIHAIHLGNSMYINGGGWTSTIAQGNGIANGQTQVFINVTWDSYEGNSSFYGHFNQTYTLPCKVFILNCKYINRANIQNVGRQSCYLGDRYTGQRNTIYVYNSDLPTFLPNTMKMNPGSMADGTGEPITERSVKEICLPHVIGSGNSPMVTDASKINCLTFATKNLGEKIEVIGGTAKDDIFGVESKNIYGSGVKGETRGSNYIVEGTYSHVNNLAYILGNCANNPKTLIVRVTDVNNSYTDHIITFDKNYMTQDGSSYSYNTTPYISQSDIIAEVNDSFNDFTMSDGYWIVSTFDDCKDTLVNTGSTGLSQGMAVVRDYANGYKCVRMANAGEKAEGVAADSIAIGSIGDIILFKKNLMHRSYIHLGSLTKGTLYKVGSNGGFISTNTEDEAVLVAVDENILSYFGR